MQSLKKTLPILGVLLFSLPAQAALFKTEIEPIVGYERVQKIVPVAHTRDRWVYGARVTMGILWIAGEAEYTQGRDTEDFPAQTLRIVDVTDKAKLGLRFRFRLLRMLKLTVRGGAQAARNRHEETLAGVRTVVYQPIVYKPYLGAGLSFDFTKHFSFNGDLVTVFNDFPEFRNNEYMVTAGFVVRFP